MFADRNCCTRCDNFSSVSPWENLQPLIDSKMTSLQWKLGSRCQLGKHWNSSKKNRELWKMIVNLSASQDIRECKLSSWGIVLGQSSDSDNVQVQAAFDLQSFDFPIGMRIENSSRHAMWGEVRLQHRKKMAVPCSKTLNQTSAEHSKRWLHFQPKTKAFAMEFQAQRED